MSLNFHRDEAAHMAQVNLPSFQALLKNEYINLISPLPGEGAGGSSREEAE